MRAIDNYTDKEIETLHLKGMLADNKANARKADAEAIRKAYRRTTTEEQFAKEQGNKAQHSPLPWQASKSGVTITTGPMDRDLSWTATYLRICTLNCNETDMPESQRKANAQLIVRAVNHADKLAGCLKWIRKFPDVLEDKFYTRDIDKLIADYESEEQ